MVRTFFPVLLCTLATAAPASALRLRPKGSEAPPAPKAPKAQYRRLVGTETHPYTAGRTDADSVARNPPQQSVDQIISSPRQGSEHPSINFGDKTASPLAASASRHDIVERLMKEQVALAATLAKLSKIAATGKKVSQHLASKDAKAGLEENN